MAAKTSFFFMVTESVHREFGSRAAEFRGVGDPFENVEFPPRPRREILAPLTSSHLHRRHQKESGSLLMMCLYEGENLVGDDLIDTAE